jgi:hypothetical protein
MDVDALIEQWRLYAKANQAQASQNRQVGDQFGAELCLARGSVRSAAANMLDLHRDDPVAVAKNMHRNAGELRQHHWPFVGLTKLPSATPRPVPGKTAPKRLTLTCPRCSRS